MTPYPLIYTPQDVPKPLCCAHKSPVRVGDASKCPDYDAVAKTGGFGLLWGSADPAAITARPWTKMPGGAYVQLGHAPQHLLRITRHPRVVHRRWIPGAHPEHQWSVPVLLTWEPGTQPGQPDVFTPTVDGIWNGSEWTQGELEPLYQDLVGFIQDNLGGPSIEERNTAFRKLAVDLLAVDQWVDEGLMAVNGWLGLRFMTEVVMAAGALTGSATPAAV